MARARTGTRRKRTRTNWLAAAVDTVHTNITIPMMPHAIVLFAPLITSVSPVTVLRIVGEVHPYLDAVAPAGGAVVSMMIYRKQKSQPTFNPQTVSGFDNDDVMWTRSFYFVEGALMADGVNFHVDVRVARVLLPNESEIVISMNSAVAWNFAANLRMLLKEP